jgi:hypothetical protein
LLLLVLGACTLLLLQLKWAGVAAGVGLLPLWCWLGLAVFVVVVLCEGQMGVEQKLCWIFCAEASTIALLHLQH